MYGLHMEIYITNLIKILPQKNCNANILVQLMWELTPQQQLGIIFVR